MELGHSLVWILPVVELFFYTYYVVGRQFLGRHLEVVRFVRGCLVRGCLVREYLVREYFAQLEPVVGSHFVLVRDYDRFARLPPVHLSNEDNDPRVGNGILLPRDPQLIGNPGPSSCIYRKAVDSCQNCGFPVGVGCYPNALPTPRKMMDGRDGDLGTIRSLVALVYCAPHCCYEGEYFVVRYFVS